MKKFLVFLAATSFAAGAFAAAPSNDKVAATEKAAVEAESVKSSVIITSASAKIEGTEVKVKFSASNKDGKDVSIKGIVCEAANKVVAPKDKAAVITSTPKEFVVSASEFKNRLPIGGSVTLVLQLDSGETVEVKAIVAGK